jgi:hypothetical protein
MFKFVLTLLFVAGFVTRGRAGEMSPSGREEIEWCDIWISHANETNLPRVLILGDSIARDYYSVVEKRLEGKAYVARLTTSRFVADPVLLQEIALVLDNTKFDVIHFNNGMHGWQHSEEEYKSAFPKLLKTLHAHAPQAKLVWASTTPIKVSSYGNATDPSNERIAERNVIALGCMKGRNIVIDDLNGLMRGHQEYFTDNVHFNEKAIGLESDRVAAIIDPLLRNLGRGTDAQVSNHPH